MPNGEGMGDSTTLPSPEEIAAAWAARPAYVSHARHETEAAYAFAVARPDRHGRWETHLVQSIVDPHHRVTHVEWHLGAHGHGQ
jgi:hypothetical protein